MRVRLLTLLALIQLLLGGRVIWRLLRTGGGTRIMVADDPVRGARVTVLLPVLNEADRVRPCLEGLLAQSPEASAILVIDGGSTDATREIVATFAARDDRVRLLDASPVPTGVNGKAHGLQTGVAQADPSCEWVLTIDADVRPAPGLTRSLLAKSAQTGDAVLSVATRQRLSGLGEGVLHPALLTTLVYRYGIPGHATRDPAQAQANGQCCLIRRAALDTIGGFAPGLHSVCEDVTIAREIAAQGGSVGLYEARGLVWTAMYADWRDAWRNWTRSLPMLDDRSGVSGWLGLAEVLLVQALPLPLLLLLTRRARLPSIVNAVLMATRLGTLIGAARAYTDPPWTYWLSPLADLPVAVKLLQSAVKRRHTWRGHVISRANRGDD